MVEHHDDHPDMKPYESWLSIVDSIDFVICTIFLILYIYGFRGSQKIQSVMKWITMLYIISYVIRYLCTVLVWIIKIINDSKELDIFDKISGHLGFIVAHFLFYLLMIARLYFGFLGSSLEIQKWAIYLYIISLFIMCIINFIYFFIINYGNGKYVILSILVCFDVIFGAFLIWSFTRRLFKLIVMQREELNNEKKLSINTIKSSPIEYNKQQETILQTITKYTLLCTIAIISKNVHFFVWSLLGITNSISPITEIIMKYTWCIILFIELSSVYLSFSFAKSKYLKFCKCCHSRLQLLCQTVASLKIQKQIIEDSYQQLL